MNKQPKQQPNSEKVSMPSRMTRPYTLEKHYPKKERNMGCKCDRRKVKFY